LRPSGWPSKPSPLRTPGTGLPRVAIVLF